MIIDAVEKYIGGGFADVELTQRCWLKSEHVVSATTSDEEGWAYVYLTDGQRLKLKGVPSDFMEQPSRFVRLHQQVPGGWIPTMFSVDKIDMFGNKEVCLTGVEEPIKVKETLEEIEELIDENCS